MGSAIKKTLRAKEQDRTDIAEKRCEWVEFQKEVQSNRLVFLDESSAKTNMTRLRGRSLRGLRCYDTSPCGHWQTITMLSSIRLDGTNECVIIDGAMDKAMFTEYIAQILSPALHPGDIVVMDNLSSHKSPDVSKHIEACGAHLLYLPPYSPDLNPIEKMWSKVKQFLRSLKAQTYEALENAIVQALDAVSATDAEGWFKSCGYELSQT